MSGALLGILLSAHLGGAVGDQLRTATVQTRYGAPHRSLKARNSWSDAARARRGRLFEADETEADLLPVRKELR